MRKTILIVEDEPPIVQIIRANLLLEGYEVIAAYDGDKGLEVYGTSRPDLIISDVMMPGISGFELVKEVRRVDASTPIILMDGLMAHAADRKRGYEAGATWCEPKPFEPSELLHIVAWCLSGDQARLRDFRHQRQHTDTQ